MAATQTAIRSLLALRREQNAMARVLALLEEHGPMSVAELVRIQYETTILAFHTTWRLFGECGIEPLMVGSLIEPLWVETCRW